MYLYLVVPHTGLSEGMGFRHMETARRDAGKNGTIERIEQAHIVVAWDIVDRRLIFLCISKREAAVGEAFVSGLPLRCGTCARKLGLFGILLVLIASLAKIPKLLV